MSLCPFTTSTLTSDDDGVPVQVVSQAWEPEQGIYPTVNVQIFFLKKTFLYAGEEI